MPNHQAFTLLMLLLVVLTNLIRCGCPVGKLVPDLDACLVFDDDGLPFEYAEKVCVRSGGHLIALHNVFENSLVLSMARNYSINTLLMIGLKRNENEWKWTDSSMNNYAYWATGEPMNGDCAAAYLNDNKWKSIDCSEVVPYVCKIPVIGSSTTSKSTIASTKAPTTTTTTVSSKTSPKTLPTGSTASTETQESSFSTPAQEPCPPQWIHLQSTDKCYFHGRKSSFEAAESFCVSFGGHLASVHSDDENEFIKQLTWVNYCNDFNGYNYGSTFLGGYLNTEGNQLEWLDGSEDDFRGNICGTSNKPSFIMLRSFPGKCSSNCKDGDWWPMDSSPPNTTISDFICKTAANTQN